MSRRKAIWLFLLYAAIYAALRLNGDIVYQKADLRAGSVVGRRHIVGVVPYLPHWRRQVHRALFSPLMVAEEEAWRLADEIGETARSAGAAWPN